MLFLLSWCSPMSVLQMDLQYNCSLLQGSAVCIWLTHPPGTSRGHRPCTTTVPRMCTRRSHTMHTPTPVVPTLLADTHAVQSHDCPCTTWYYLPVTMTCRMAMPNSSAIRTPRDSDKTQETSPLRRSSHVTWRCHNLQVRSPAPSTSPQARSAPTTHAALSDIQLGCAVCMVDPKLPCDCLSAPLAGSIRCPPPIALDVPFRSPSMTSL